jgi:hypothetical protein
MKFAKSSTLLILVAGLVVAFSIHASIGAAPGKQALKSAHLSSAARPATASHGILGRQTMISATEKQERAELARLRRSTRPEDKARLVQLSERYAVPEGRNHLDNAGGPDGAAYRYVDNVAPDTATYSWIELRGDAGATWVPASQFVGTRPPTDDVYKQVPIGFTFPFYSTNFTTVNCFSNGSLAWQGNRC